MDEDNDNVLTRRGYYKRYLQDNDVPVPESTIRSRRQREQMSLQQEHEMDVIDDISMISEQLSVSSNDNERAIAAEDISEDSDQSINDPISSGNPENNDADTSMDDISVVNRTDSDTASISDGSNSSIGNERQSVPDIAANDNTSDLEDVFQNYEEFLEPAGNVDFVLPEDNDQIKQLARSVSQNTKTSCIQLTYEADFYKPVGNEIQLVWSKEEKYLLKLTVM
ncbi:uncharacterized protein LOC115242101 isoform X2 [Formica exsecta]|uniref:uncharacterized protein LOC115242101 isoform X2 n=1 Tax=Formica exsecta TaxID=72781 RepID=UPI00114426DC|nr:uncharacterized protein LOC115242101 isoform X2 [Formica exsecta]